MKNHRNNLLILIFTFIMLTVNLTSNVFAAIVPVQLLSETESILAKSVESVAVQNPTYTKSNLKIEKLLTISNTNSNEIIISNNLEENEESSRVIYGPGVMRVSLHSSLTIPNHLNATVGNNVINTIRYDDFYLEVKRISTDVGPAYCLEVEKDYPSGQTFEFTGKPVREVVGMMAAGFPNKSAVELGLESDDDAYFATQMAIWCVTEGYEPVRFRAKDKALLQAIKNIYNEGMQYTGNDLDHTAMEYYYNDSVQRIVVYINSPIETPDEGTGGGNEEVPDIPTWPEIPDDEDEVEVPEEDESENVVVPGLG